MFTLQAALKRRRVMRWQRREEKLVRCETQIQRIWTSHFQGELQQVLKALRQNWDRNSPILQKMVVPAVKGSKVVSIMEAATFSEGIYQVVNAYIFGKMFDWLNNKVNARTEATLQTAFKNTGITIAVDSAANAGVDFKGFPTATQRWIDQHIPKIVSDIGETTRRRIFSTIVEGAQAGDSYKEMSIRIREIYDGFSRARAFRIARNEAGMVAAQTEWDMWAESPYADRVMKVWRDTGDDRVRDLHQIDGEAIPREELFSNGLRFPRDPDGEPENVINCRCWLEWEV